MPVPDLRPIESPTPPPPSKEEADLLAGLRRGDDQAFEALVRRFSGAMLAAIRRILRNEDDARDALQDAFVSVFRAVGRYQGESRLATWLHRIAVNAALMKLRGRRRHPEASIEALLPRFQDDGHEVVPNEPWKVSEAAADEAIERATRAETRELVRRAIDELPETYRVVLILRDIEELSTDEAAHLLEVTPNAVKIRLHRARQALRAKLDPSLRLPPAPDAA